MHDADRTPAQRLTGEAALRQQLAAREAEVAACKQTLTQLQESEARYRDLFENASDIMYTLDWMGNLTSVNKAGERLLRLLGYTYDAAHPINVHGVLLAPDFQGPSRQMRAIKDAGAAWTTYEVELMTQDGQRLPLEVSTRLIYMDGQPVGVEGIARDISARKQVEARLQQAYQELEQRVQERTADLRQLNAQLQADIAERKQVEETLRASEALNRSIVEAMPGGIIQVSQEGRIVRANAEAQHILGLTYDRHTNRFAAYTAPQFVWEDGRPCKEKEDPIARCLATHKPQQATTMGIRHPDGTITWAVFTAIPLRAPATGELIGAVTTFLDITERKQAEEERKLLEAQLRQSHKMEAIGTMAGGIAHDFNNILGAILNFTELAQYEVPSESGTAANLREVLQAGRRAKALVQQILTFSHQSEMQRQPVQLALLVKETLTLLRASLPTTIDVQQDIAEDSGVVLADPTQMHQILMNICTNAEYAMRETGGILAIRVQEVEVDAAMIASHPQLRPGPYVCLTIRDTGQGMPPDMVGRIFDPFFTTKSVGEGTGMGLAVVHGIVVQHGGAITVESTLGVGSTFTIYLPRGRATVEKRTPSREGSTPQGTGRILFVDDEVTITHSMSLLLESLGYEVSGHTSGQEALATFRVEPQRFDLVITDQTMPHMTGETLAKEVRQLRPDIPIILCTGFSHVMNAEKAHTLGIDAFCMKPVTVRDLGMTIQQVLTQRAGRDAELHLQE
jgi:PAS domain S-box-containing protein